MNKILVVACLVFLAVASPAAAPDGATVYKDHCAICHEGTADTRAPGRDAMARLTPDAIVKSLVSGSMAAQGKPLSDNERRAVAAYLARGGGSTSASVEAQPAACPASAFPADPFAQPHWNGWGVQLTGGRIQPDKMARLTARDVPRLKLKWAFGFANVGIVPAQPVVVGGRVFVGSLNGKVYSLDARTGCTYWSIDVTGGVRSAITIGPAPAGSPARFLAYFGDLRANVHAVDAATGKPVWKTKIEEHPAARLTGSPLLHGGRLYVTVSSIEEVSGGNPKYECCKFRGSVVALDARTGEQVWKTHTIAQPPEPTRKNSVGTQMWGPAGAAVWSAPSLDLKRKTVYVATGNAYTAPHVETSNAVLALDMDTGKLRWARQLTPGDTWTFACSSPSKTNCEDGEGPDYDLGNTPILRQVAGGKSILTVGQKSGIAYGLDPDRDGAIVWQERVGQGSKLGGVQWGPAADDKVVYMPVSDIGNPGPEGAGGLFALELATGKRLWHTPAPQPECAKGAAPASASGLTPGRGCSGAQSAAISIASGVVFSGSIDGKLRAYSAKDGRILWEVDTAQEYTTVNGVKGRGGSLDASGPAIVNGMVFVNSGYGIFGNKAGNVLLAFSVDGK